MITRFGLLASALGVGLMVLPFDCYGFGAGLNASAHCTASQTVPCTVALILPSEAIVQPADAVVPLPLPRPPDLGRPACSFSDRASVQPEDCR